MVVPTTRQQLDLHPQLQRLATQQRYKTFCLRSLELLLEVETHQLKPHRRRWIRTQTLGSDCPDQ
jgi:hypothetical protein